MKKVLRKSNLVAGILILVVVCLGIVLAGDVIVKEGDLATTGTGTFGNGSIVTQSAAVEKQENGDFETGDFTHWTAVNWNVGSYQAKTEPPTTASSLTSDFSPTVGRWYTVSFDYVTKIGSGNFDLDFGGGNTIGITTTGAKTYNLYAYTTDALVFSTGSIPDFTVVIDDVSILEEGDTKGFSTSGGIEDTIYRAGAIEGDKFVLNVNKLFLNDKLFYGGEFAFDLVPSHTIIYDLGSSAKSWGHIYTWKIYADKIMDDQVDTTYIRLSPKAMLFYVDGKRNVWLNPGWITVNIDGEGVDFNVNADDRSPLLNCDVSEGNVGIRTSSPSYPLEVNDDVSDISIWASKKVSATGYITRTSVFDKSKNAWDYIKDAGYYLTDGKIDHKKFYGYAGEFEVTDYSRPVVIEEFDEDLNMTIDKTTYPYKTTEEGILLDEEINLLRQAVFELRQENQMLKDDIARLKEAVGIE